MKVHSKGLFYMKKYLAMDVGGTNIKFALLDEEANILEKDEKSTPMESLEVYLSKLYEIVDHYKDEIEAIVMSVPGRVDAQKGIAHTGGALTFVHELNMRQLFEDRYHKPFALENDAKAAALAELWKGSMVGVKNGSVMTLGTGIGGSIIIDGKLYRGNHFSAGEFSMINSNYNVGFKEFWAMNVSVARMCSNYAMSLGQDPANMNGRILFAHALEGNKKALAAIEEYCDYFVAGLLTLQTILDLDRIAIGGGISKQPLLFEVIHRKYHELYDPAASYVPFLSPEIVPCIFGNDANMIGALYHYLFELKK